MRTAAKESRIQCLDRALDILETVAERGEIGVTELAQALGLHVATTHNILTTLAARRYLLSDGGRYRIGPSLELLGNRWDPLALLPRLAKPRLEEITAATGEAAVTTVLVGEMAVMVAVTLGTHEVTTQYPQDMWPDPLCLSTGRVLVAHEEDTRRAIFIRRHLQGNGYPAERMTQEVAAVEEMLSRTRREGIGIVDNPQGVYSVAAPVRAGEKARVIAAVGVSCPAFRANAAQREAMDNAVRAAASALSAQL